jgi:hypothetical protein
LNDGKTTASIYKTCNIPEGAHIMNSRLLSIAILQIVVCSCLMAATISGKTTYAGSFSGVIYVAAYTDTVYTIKPNIVTMQAAPGNYTLTGVPDGTYYVLSIMITDSAKGPQLTDPWGGHLVSGKLTPVVVSGGNNVSDIDITLENGSVTRPNPFYKDYIQPQFVAKLPDVTTAGKNPALCSDGVSIYLYKHDYSGAPTAKMYKLNPSTGALLSSYDLSLVSSANGTSWINSMIWYNGSIWATGGFGDPSNNGIYVVGVFKFDPVSSLSSNQKSAATGIDTDSELGGLATDGTSLYVGAKMLPAASGSGGIIKFDPATTVVPLTPFYSLGTNPNYLSYGGGYLWAGTDGVEKIDPANGAVMANYNIPPSAAGLFFNNMLWRYDENDNTLKAYDVSPTDVPLLDGIPIPGRFTMDQNYPNPFNPSTQINYRLPERSTVRLRVFDVLGKEVATLVNTEQDGGNHSVQFEAEGLRSGVYFYTLTAGKFSSTRKMLLVR